MFKRILTLIGALLFVGWSASCSRKTAPQVKEDYQGPMVSYNAQIAPIMERSCSPCHYPAQNGSKAALDSYESLKAMVSAVIARVELPDDDAKFMPFKHKKESLTQEEITLIKNWARGGFPE